MDKEIAQLAQILSKLYWMQTEVYKVSKTRWYWYGEAISALSYMHNYLVRLRDKEKKNNEGSSPLVPHRDPG